MFVQRRMPATGWPLVLGLAIALGLAAGAVRAATPDVYEVRGIPVDVTAETAAAARDNAIAEGHRKAFERLLARLTLRADRDRVPRLSQEAIAAYVRDFSVNQEKTSATRYLANLDFRFKRDEIRRLLGQHGVPFAETPSKPVLVLPAYQEAGAVLLWDSPNPWRSAWEQVPATAGLVPLVLPLGDLTDIAAIGAEQAVRGDAQRLTAIAQRYGAGDAMVAHAVKAADARGGATRIDVTATRYGTAAGNQTLVRTFTAASGETDEALLRRAAADIAVEIEDDWKRDNLLNFGDPAVISVVVPIESLGDWLAVRDRLAGVAVVRQTDLILLSRTEARVNLHVVGSAEQLVLALAQADLTLAPENQQWVLRSQRRGS